MICELCGRDVDDTNRHHLIPQTRANKKVKRDFSKEERRETVDLCHPCHDNIHAMFSEKELERSLHTIEQLKAEPKIIKYIEWIKDKPKDFKPKVIGRKRR